MRWRTGSCATSNSPRTRRSRRCSPSGVTSPGSTIRRASTPRRIGSSCAPATPRVAEATTGLRTCDCFLPMSRCRRTARARSSIATSSTQLPEAFHRSPCGGGVHRYLDMPLDQVADALGVPPGRSDLDFIMRCAATRGARATLAHRHGRWLVSADRDADRIVRSWLEEGVTTLPDRPGRRARPSPATPQRRFTWWRRGGSHP